jgi:transmembrane sensor
METHEEDMRITQEAAQWFMELQAGNRACHEPFTRWLRRSPEHVEEFLAVTGISLKLDRMDPQRLIDVDALLAQAQSNLLPLRAPVETHAARALRRRPRNLWIGGAIAACALGVAGMLASWLAPWPDTYATGVGEQRAFQLDDGSVIFLNTQSRVRVDYSATARDIRLVEGEALFTVERDAVRPFRVRSGTATVQALGTQFNVYRSAGLTKVFVVEGAVQVSSELVRASSAGDSVKLSAGEQADVRRDRIEKIVPDDAGGVTAWRERKLIFHDKPLAEVVGEFNRYNPVKFEVEEGDYEPLSGVFAADRPESFARFLEKDESLRIERQGDRFLIRPRNRER